VIQDLCSIISTGALCVIAYGVIKLGYCMRKTPDVRLLSQVVAQNAEVGNVSRANTLSPQKKTPEWTKPALTNAVVVPPSVNHSVTAERDKAVAPEGGDVLKGLMGRSGGRLRPEE